MSAIASSKAAITIRLVHGERRIYRGAELIGNIYDHRKAILRCTDMRPADPLRYLPLYARCSLEFLDNQADRSIAKLNAYLAHYAHHMACEVDEHARFSAHAIALLRFAPETMDATGSVAVWPAAVDPTLANAVYRPSA